MLSAKELTARLEGTGARVLNMRGPGDSLMLLLVMDLTGDLTLADMAKQALMDEVRQLPAQTLVGLLRAQDGLKVLMDPTADRTVITEAIRTLSISGKAGFLTTVETAGRLADSILGKTGVRIAILYVTDSDVRNYREDFTNPVINSSDVHDLSRAFPETLVQERISSIESALARQQAPVFLVHLNYRDDRLNQAYQNGLKRLADATAGSSAFCRSSPDIPAAIKKAFSLIESHYSVTLAVPDRTPRSLSIQLKAGDGQLLNYRTRFVFQER